MNSFAGGPAAAGIGRGVRPRFLQRDEAVEPPRVPIGTNANSSELQALCPRRIYERCFGNALSRRYTVHDLFSNKHPDARAVDRAQERFRNARCGSQVRNEPMVRPRVASFTTELPAVLSASTSLLSAAMLVPPLISNNQDARQKKQVSDLLVRIASFPQGTASKLRCNSSLALLNSRLTLVLGVPSSPGLLGRARRDAARQTWMRDDLLGDQVLACFLLSSYYREDELQWLVEEAREHGDMLFLQAPESSMILKRPTRYSNFTKAGRGMPTFKQFAFFRLSATCLGNVPFIGKTDDDTAVNLQELVPFVSQLRCVPYAFIGAMNWASIVPRAEWSGVRGDRCGFGWTLGAALKNYGQSFGEPNTKGFLPACDTVGGVPPFPYATGAGYVFSSALLQWLGNSSEINDWVSSAGGVERERLQWQKFEDLTTGYWLSYSAERIDYFNVGSWIHDFGCHPEGQRKRQGGGLYRPAAPASLLVHGLKRGGFHDTWELMQRGSLYRGYEHQRCLRDRLQIVDLQGHRAFRSTKRLGRKIWG
mmetsp:Transcript_70120/g.116475  ORF Transcript_70120/g.116475 Transcript_70120/m.116475 type:complete len:536 (-) Transcript_70120:177-1784(-)